MKPSAIVSKVGQKIPPDILMKLRAVPVQEFGDSPGHPFRGNQWTSGASADLDDAVQDWTTGGYVYAIAEAEAVLKGSGPATASMMKDMDERDRTPEGERSHAVALLDAIDNAPPSSPELLRGLNSDMAADYGRTDFEERIAPYLQEGGTVDIPLASFTTEQSIAEAAALYAGDTPKVGVLIHVDAGAKALDVSSNPTYAKEKEWVSSGTFHVDRVEQTPTGEGTTKYDVYLRQTDTFTIPKQERQEFGDLPGHPFRGNQWTGESGSAEPAPAAPTHAFRGLTMKTSDEMFEKLRVLEVPVDMDYMKQRHALGEELLAQMAGNRGGDGAAGVIQAGLGRHWTTNEDWSEKAANATSSNDSLRYKLEADLVPEQRVAPGLPSEKMWEKTESEIMVNPDDPVRVTQLSVQLGGQSGEWMPLLEHPVTVHGDGSVTASLEFGDYEGHPFRGNQYTDVGDTQVNYYTGEERKPAVSEHIAFPKNDAELRAMVQDPRSPSNFLDGSPITPDSKIVVFHGTEQRDLKNLLKYGSEADAKPWSLARERFEKGEPAIYSPGAGLGGGLYVTTDPNEASGYGHKMVAITTTVKDLELPPEITGQDDYDKYKDSPIFDPLRTARSGTGVVINSPVDPANFREYGVARPGYIPKVSMDEFGD